MASRFQFALPNPRPRDGWFRIGNIDITTTALLVIAAVASMFLYAINKTWFYKLAFDPLLVRDGDLWRLVTWPVPNRPDRIWVVLTLLFTWFIGHAVEEMLGRIRYAILVGLLVVVPATAVTALPPSSFPFPPLGAVGLALLASPLFVLFAAEHPHAPFFFGVPAWIIAAVFIGIDVLGVVGDRLWGLLVMMVVGIGIGLIVIRQWGFAERLSFIPSIGRGRPHPPRRGPAPPRPTSRRSSERSADRRRSGQVVEGPWSAPTPPRPSADAAAAQAELDSLLEKIHATGLDSLTADEKRRLNDLSKRLR